jgi:hypothetical protein
LEHGSCTLVPTVLKAEECPALKLEICTKFQEAIQFLLNSEMESMTSHRRSIQFNGDLVFLM